MAGSTTVHFPCYALRVKPRHEKSVAEALEWKGYDQFLPLYECRRRWNHANFQTVRTSRLPLFPGYVFCRFDSQGSLPVLQTPGVQNIVSFARKPVPLAEEELAALGRVVESRLSVGPHPLLRVGSYVQVRQGPLSGLSGFLEVVKGRNRLVIGVLLLQRAVSVEIESNWVVPALRPAGPRAEIAAVRTAVGISA